MIIDKMEKDELTYHVPVLLKESVDGMNIQPDGTYVDVTFGGAGHSREILSRLGEGGRLLGFDQDEDAERNIVNDTHFIFVRSNFRYLHNFLRYHRAAAAEMPLTWPDEALKAQIVAAHSYALYCRDHASAANGSWLSADPARRQGYLTAAVLHSYCGTD